MKTHLQITFPQHPGQAFPIAASNGNTLERRARSDVRKGKGYPIRILTRAEWDDQNRPAGPYLAAYQPKRPVPDVDFEAEDGSLWPTAEACLEHELEVRFGVKTLDAMGALVEAMRLQIKTYEEKWISIVTDKATQKRTLKEVVQEGYGPMPQVQEMTEGHGLYDKNGNPPFSGVPILPPHWIEAAELATGCGVIPPKAMTAEEEATALAQVPTASTITNATEPTPAEAARLLASAVSQRGLKVADAAKATGLSPAQVKATAASLLGQFEERGGRVFLVANDQGEAQPPAKKP